MLSLKRHSATYTSSWHNEIEDQQKIFTVSRKLGCSYVDNEMLEEDAAASEWMRRNRNCDLFMKRVDPSLERDAYSIHEEARKADTSSHIFSIHYQGSFIHAEWINLEW